MKEKLIFLKQSVFANRGSWCTIPNSVTYLRIIFSPFVVYYFWFGDKNWGVCIAVVAALTDAFDGAIARWLKEKTQLGAFLDTAADKIFVAALIGCLPAVGVKWQTLGWIFVLEGCTAAGACFFPLKVRWWGKCKTAAQYLVMVAILCGLSWFKDHENDLMLVVVWLTFTSLFLYGASILATSIFVNGKTLKRPG